MKCSVAAIFGAALVLGSSKQPSQSDNRNVASRDNPVPGAFQPNRIGTNKDAGGGVLGLSFESSISGGDSINGSNDNNKSPGEERAEKEASKDDNNSSFDKEKVAEAFADDSNNGNNLLHDFGHQNLSVQGGEDTEKSISARGEYQLKLLDMTERLTEISRNHLRGYNQRASDRESGVLETIGEIKDLIRSKVDQLKTFRTLIEAVGIKQLKDLLFSFISDAVSAGKAIAGSTGSDKELNDVGADLALADEGNGHEMVEYLAGMDRGELASTVVSNELIGHMELLADTLSDVEETLSPPQRRTRGPSKSKSNVKQPPNLGSAAGNPRTPRVSRHLREKQSYRPLPHLKHVDRLWAAAGEEGRRHLEEMTVAPQCFACEEDEIQCNCRRLKECSLELTWYDLAVRLVGGFIDSDPDSDTYGQLLTEDMNDIDVFEARNKLNQKMAEIKRLADPLLPVNEDNCNALLSELVTACGEGSCSNPNQYSFQLSVNDVCQAVDTPIKFGIKPMGEFYDFRYFAVRYFSEKIVFVTSETYTGNIGGLAGADARCQERAEAAGLPGTFKAWLSDRTISVSQRFDRDFDHVALVRTDGVRVANDWSDLTDGTLLGAINRDEFGNTGGANSAWTNTDTGGNARGVDRDCNQWRTAASTGSSRIGTVSQTDFRWTVHDTTGVTCNSRYRLYCFQQQPELTAESPLNVKHAVRCCRDDDGEEDIWYRSPAASCHVNALAETWTGELPPGAQLDAPPGYTGYPGRTCRKEDDNDDGYSVTSAQECGDLCDRDADCDSFDLTGGNTCFLHTSCHHYSETDTTRTASNFYRVWNGGCENIINGGSAGVVTAESNSYHTLEECAERCASYAVPRCTGFFHRTSDEPNDGNGHCHLYFLECEGPSSDTKWDYYRQTFWYFKHHDIIPAGYARQSGAHCDTGPRVFYYDIRTVQECANICSADDSCVSFNYGRISNGNAATIGRCDYVTDTISTSPCDDLRSAAFWNWYHKKEGFQDDETECLFMTHGDAEEHCEDSGGRLCTKEELEDGCASFMGCGFDSSLVWSSTETSPEVCETDPSQQATSYASCGNFVSAMEQLYVGRPDTFAEEENPLRLNAASQASSDFENVQFPTRFNWIIDQTNGIASLVDTSPYLYDFEESLSTSDADLFCDAGLGPPTVLAQACDASMDFLLGSSVSIGMLTSTAKAVNDFAVPASSEVPDEITSLEINQSSNPDLVRGAVKVFDRHWTMSGSGLVNVNSDAFQYSYVEQVGDIESSVQILQVNDFYWGQTGIMLRESLDPDSKFVAICFEQDRLNILYRDTVGQLSQNNFGGGSARGGADNVLYSQDMWIRITKSDNLFGTSYSLDGIQWEYFSSVIVGFESAMLHVGLFTVSQFSDTVMASNFKVNDMVYSGFPSSPRWLEWYTGLKHNPVVDFVDEWTEFYLNITDAREMPAWFDVYLKIMDGSVRRLEPRREGRIYCRDDGINYGDTKNSIEKCNRAWLNQTSNPYDDYMEIYKSTPPQLPTGLIAEEVAGSAGSVSVSSKGLEMTGSGTLGGQRDTFFFAYGQHSGDFVVEVRLQVSSADLEDLYAGLMIRESSSPGSIYYAAGVDNGNQFQTSYRKEPSGTADVFTGQSAGASGVWLKITKANNVFSAQSSTDRINWNSIGSSSALEFSNGALRAGVFVTGGATVIASDLSVTKLYGVATEYDVCEHDVCLEDWLGFDGIPYEEDHGCYEFYWSCVLNRPEMYQCQQFWDFCRDELIELEPKWDETITVDDKGVVSKQFCNNNKDLTCDLDYLENSFDFEQESFACQDFATYCRNELNLTHPKYVYPPKYCRMPDEPDELGNRELTCQLDWIDDETRLDDEECNDFKEYCQTQLVITYPRYVWPLPRSPVIDDFMPGYCCLDTPTGTDFESEFWGQHYDSSQDGMKCQNRGKWHMGMSDEACSNGGGQWFRTPCITLYRCIDARPRKDEDGYSESFEEFVVENEIEIYDHTDLEQCQTARAALGFDVDHPNDHEVCEEFNNRLCDLFFRDLDFLAGGADGEEVKFEQVTYTPIEYPPDPPLEYRELPRLKNFAIRDKKDGGEIDHLHGLQKAKFTLDNLYKWGKDVFEKNRDFAQDACKLLAAKCNTAKLALENAEAAVEMASNTCNLMPTVVFGASNPVYLGCKAKFSVKESAMNIKKIAKETACKVKEDAKCTVLEPIQRYNQWAVLYGVGEALKAIDAVILHINLPDMTTNEEFEFTEATYDNVISLHEWNAEALDIVNFNIREQHTQMRSELQARHQDITNDVNQFTTCMSNFLGIQIFNALPGASAGDLSTLCSNLLGVGSGRRRLGSNEGPYSLKVTYDDSSFIEDIKEIQGAEEEIVDELHNVEEIELDILQKQEQILVEMKEIREAMDIPPRPSLPTRPPTRPPTVVVTTPRPSSYGAAAICGNDSCEMDETDKSCPKDCTNVQLDTTSYDQSMASSSESIRFAIKAKRAVAIKSLSFYTSTTARNSEITVKTQEGQYGRGIFSDWTTDGWTTVFHGRVVARGYVSGGAQLTTVKFDQDLVVPADKAQSFEVQTVSSRIMVQLGGQEGMLAGQDMALEVYVGRSGAQSPAAFGGIIEYDGLDDGSTAGGRSNTGGRSKSAKAKTAKLEKDEMLVTGTNTAFLQAESNGEEEVVALDLVRFDCRALGDKVGAMNDKMGAMNDKMGALEENVQVIKADYKGTNDDVQSIKADVKATNDKILALETKLGSLETKLGSMEGMIAQMVKLLEAPGDAEEEIGGGSTN